MLIPPKKLNITTIEESDLITIGKNISSNTGARISAKIISFTGAFSSVAASDFPPAKAWTLKRSPKTMTRTKHNIHFFILFPPKEIKDFLVYICIYVLMYNNKAQITCRQVLLIIPIPMTDHHPYNILFAFSTIRSISFSFSLLMCQKSSPARCFCTIS